MMLGEKIQRLRKERGMSQEQLAERLAISRQAVSKWELGESMPDTENVVQLSKFFDVSNDYLLNDEINSNIKLEPNPIGPARKKGIGQSILVVLAIYMLMFAVAIFINPLLMPFFGMFAAGISIFVVIIMKRH